MWFHRLACDFIALHLVSSPCIWFHRLACDFIALHLVSLPCSWFHPLLSGFIALQVDFIAWHSVSSHCSRSYGPARSASAPQAIISHLLCYTPYKFSCLHHNRFLQPNAGARLCNAIDPSQRARVLQLGLYHAPPPEWRTDLLVFEVELFKCSNRQSLLPRTPISFDGPTGDFETL